MKTFAPFCVTKLYLKKKKIFYFYQTIEKNSFIYGLLCSVFFNQINFPERCNLQIKRLWNKFALKIYILFIYEKHIYLLKNLFMANRHKILIISAFIIPKNNIIVFLIYTVIIGIILLFLKIFTFFAI